MRSRFSNTANVGRGWKPQEICKNQSDSAPPYLLSIERAAASIAVSRAYFYEHVLHHLETVRLGKRNLVCRESLEAFIEARKQAARHVGAEG
ncbi:hypothetical protein GCM10011611_38930 [Aliidongia dinghuensis]|uniref:Helix-turn-helix domain-containing protein n=1 Tax=Aliidongia dinghuensis TaxID=1867774 RepID=A0A8J2YVU4_9PROT|nr:hypothetical protein [Aliidongia dinghuensis]GGF29067.1 hypothetical protein GCM10011611_38930 [Aliidongia dinghuensis]